MKAIVTGIMTILRSVALDRRTFGEGLLLLTPLLVGGALVIRALPGSRHAVSARLAQQLRNGLRRSHQLTDALR